MRAQRLSLKLRGFSNFLHWPRLSEWAAMSSVSLNIEFEALELVFMFLGHETTTRHSSRE